MPNLDTLRDLERRLAEATGPDREIDALIFCAFAESSFSYYGDCILARHGGFAARVELDEISHPTASLDAAVALCERALPGFQWNISRYSEDAEATIGPVSNCIWFVAKTPALALCLAIVRALIAKEEGNAN